MKREDARRKIIFALDVNGVAEIDRYAGMLSGKVGMFKVGKELFTSCGPEAGETPGGVVVSALASTLAIGMLGTLLAPPTAYTRSPTAKRPSSERSVDSAAAVVQFVPSNR